MKNILNFRTIGVFFLALGFFSCSTVTEDNSYKPQSPTKNQDESPYNTIAWYQNGETTLALEFAEFEQVFQGIVEEEGLNGVFIDASVDDIVDDSESHAYIVLFGELEDGTSTSYGLSLEKAPNETGLITYTLGEDPIHMERAWKCANNGCRRCKIDRDNGRAYNCHCIEGSGCAFSDNGGGVNWPAWIGVAIGVYKILFPPE